jgi:ribosomal protein S18 acetylase RimI-like enzyme
VPVWIRPARLADVDAMASIVERAYRPYVARIGRRPAPMDDDYAAKVRLGGVFIADDVDLVGLIVLVAHPDHILIENVAVDPSRHGEGIGRALLAFAEAHARAAGVLTLRLYTNATMTENLALYPHLGYVLVGRRTDGGFERVYFVKHLDPCERP